MSEDRAILEWQKLFDSKQTITKYRNALAGDGAGTVVIANEPGYIWCRYSADQSKVSKVFNIIAPGIPEDFPIIVGRRFPTDEFEQVLAVNWTLYQDIVTQDTVDNFTVGNHGESHNAASGSDPAPIDLRNLLEMRMRAQATPDLTVHVERGQYRWFGGVVNRFPGQDIDLTASVPGVVGHRYVLVYVNAATNILGIVEGTIVPIAFTPPIPDITANTIPVGIAELRNAQTTIDEDDIFDWRFLFQVESYNSPPLIGSHADRLALVVADLEELTRFYESDTDQVWEIWEGAWRISYPPPALTAPDGAPSPAWSLSNTGVMTGVADLVLDDGVGDSPALTLVGGTNDDQVLIFLDDAAGIGQSDLTIDLADAGGNSAMIVRDSGATPVFEVTSAGFMTVGGGTELLSLDTTECVFNDDSADIDFRVESDTDAHALFVQGSDGYVGINDSTPAARLEVSETNATGAPSLALNSVVNNAGVIVVPICMAATWIDISTANRIAGQLLRFSYVRGAAATGIPTAFDSMINLLPVLDSSMAAQLYGINLEGPIVAAAKTLSTYTAINISAPAGAGAVTTTYAILTAAGAGSTGLGTTAPDARLEIETGAAEGKQAVTIDQNDADQAFIDFQGSSGAGTSYNVNTTERNTFQSMLMIEINGTQYWLKAYQ